MQNARQGKPASSPPGHHVCTLYEAKIKKESRKPAFSLEESNPKNRIGFPYAGTGTTSEGSIVPE